MSTEFWKLKNNWTVATDLVDNGKVEPHACKRQSQELSQCEGLEDEKFCSQRHWLSLQVGIGSTGNRACWKLHKG